MTYIDYNLKVNNKSRKENLNKFLKIYDYQRYNLKILKIILHTL